MSTPLTTPLTTPLLEALERYQTRYPQETSTLEIIRTQLLKEPRCFENDCWSGHITASAWLLNTRGDSVLLTHHKKLQAWLQLGGHSDGNSIPQEVALREAREESGISDIVCLSPEIFDLDVHEIPARKEMPPHLHLDIRYVCQCTRHDDFIISEESHDLKWVPFEEVPKYSQDASVLRMQRKWLNLQQTLRYPSQSR